MTREDQHLVCELPDGTSCPDESLDTDFEFTPEEIEILMTPTPEESGVLAGPLLDRIRELEAELEGIRGASRALVDELSSPFCTPLRQCSQDGCRSVAMWWNHNGLCFCDDHRPLVLANITESSYAKPWRRVVKMVKP